VEEDKLASLREQADIWTEEEALNSEKADVEHQYSLVKRDKEALSKKREAYEAREVQRRRERHAHFNLTVSHFEISRDVHRSDSLSFIQDSFAEQSPAEVVHHLK
jgi:hypothetical protein